MDLIIKQEYDFIILAKCQKKLSKFWRKDSFLLTLRWLVVNSKHAFCTKLVSVLLIRKVLYKFEEESQILFGNRIGKKRLIETLIGDEIGVLAGREHPPQDVDYLFKDDDWRIVG